MSKQRMPIRTTTDSNAPRKVSSLTKTIKMPASLNILDNLTAFPDYHAGKCR